MQVRVILLIAALLPAALLPQGKNLTNGDKAVFTVSAIPDTVFERMQGKSYPHDCPVPRSRLRYLQVTHVDVQGVIHRGEIVCHQDIADDLIDIFRVLYEARYPIERVRLIDDYDADDERSMQENNTSCFCFRPMTNGRRLSKHATGHAVDVNPRYNPYVGRDGTMRPVNAVADGAYTLHPGDTCHQLFRRHGFKWGGAWRTVKDYQHFER